MHQERGFQKKTRTEIVEDMKSRARNLFGQSTNLAINSPLGILIELFSWPLSLLWMGLEKIYNADSVDTATSQDLDNRAKNIGITRILAAKSTGELEITGEHNTIVPEGFQVETDSQPPIAFETAEEVIIGQDGNVTVEIIAVEAGSGGNQPADTITEIVNPISGIDSVTNIEPTTGGRDRESDTEFRNRYYDSLDRPGGSTTNSIRANVLQETEATACLVLENTTMEEDEEGIPAKAFETICLGGANGNIAVAIFDKKPAGMEAFGEEYVEVTDDSGRTKLIGFSKAESVDIYVDVELMTDGSYPQDGDDQIRDEIIDYIGGISTTSDSINGLSISEDVIRAKIISRMYNVNGVIDVIKLNIGKEENDLSNSNIEIGFREVSRTEPAFIEVISSD